MKINSLPACVQGESSQLAAKASANPATHAKQVKLSEQHIKSHSIVIPNDLLLFKTYILNYTITSQAIYVLRIAFNNIPNPAL